MECHQHKSCVHSVCGAEAIFHRDQSLRDGLGLRKGRRLSNGRTFTFWDTASTDGGLAFSVNDTQMPAGLHAIGRDFNENAVPTAFGAYGGDVSYKDPAEVDVTRSDGRFVDPEFVGAIDGELHLDISRVKLALCGRVECGCQRVCDMLTCGEKTGLRKPLHLLPRQPAVFPIEALFGALIAFGFWWVHRIKAIHSVVTEGPCKRPSVYKPETFLQGCGFFVSAETEE